METKSLLGSENGKALLYNIDISVFEKSGWVTVSVRSNLMSHDLGVGYLNKVNVIRMQDL